MSVARIAGGGWLVLVGGGEFSFGETEEADRAWLEKTPPGSIGFLPAASGSVDYGRHFAAYMHEAFAREVETIPIYRSRDARRGRNCDRVGAVAALYLGGGVADHLLDALRASPALDALTARLGAGGLVVAIAAAAQALGTTVRSLRGDDVLPGLGWLPGGALETNFEPDHDRRLRKLMTAPGVSWGLGIPAGSAILLGPRGEVEVVGTVFSLDSPNGDLAVVASAHVH